MTNLIRIRTVWTGVAGAPYYTNLYYTDTGSVGDAIAAQGRIANELQNRLTGFIGGMIATVQGQIPVISDVSGQIVSEYNISDHVITFTGSGEQLPRQVQGLITWDTGSFVAGRRLRGRTFWPGAMETQNSPGGVPSTAYVAQLNGIALNLLGNPGPPARVFSRTHLTSAVITAGNAWSQWANLRSRRD
jgi:hypothetical protein